MEGITDAYRGLFFRYDRALPLDAEADAPTLRDGLSFQRVLFASTHGQRVPALLVMPANSPEPLPVVIVGHGAGGGKDEPRMQALLGSWARHGFACITADAPLHGERGGLIANPRELFERPFTGLDFVVQYGVDLMRTVDYLQTRPEIDSSRLGYAGFSMSTVLGVQFVALDPRVRAASFAIGGAGVLHFLSGMIPAERRAEYELVATLMDPMHFAPLIAPRPVIMLNALRDTLLPPPLGHILYNALKRPKEIHWYDGPHGEMPQAELDWIRRFFENELTGPTERVAGC
jgi:cephalosporin-C deacetylase-like acetyl esterase